MTPEFTMMVIVPAASITGALLVSIGYQIGRRSERIQSQLLLAQMREYYMKQMREFYQREFDRVMRQEEGR